MDSHVYMTEKREGEGKREKEMGVEWKEGGGDRERGSKEGVWGKGMKVDLITP